MAGSCNPRGGADAAQRAAAAVTPTVFHADSLDRAFPPSRPVPYSDSPPGAPPLENSTRRVNFDIVGNPREIIDARPRLVRYGYDVQGSRFTREAWEAGERWMLSDAAGKAFYSWDSRNQRLRTTYDSMRRPSDLFFQMGDDAEIVVERNIYGETPAAPEATNLRGRVFQIFDQAGTLSNNGYDFKGNLLQGKRQLARAVGPAGASAPAYQTTFDWSGTVQLENEAYLTHTRYDALNRPIQSIAPHSDQPGTKVHVIQPFYNEANLLEKVDAWLSEDSEPAGLLDPDTATLHAYRY